MKVLDEILPNNLWYIVGYIVADGNLSSDGRHISIVSKDLEHLEKIRSALKIDVKIGTTTNGTPNANKCGRLQFGNVNFYQFLESIHITPKKSLTLGPVLIDLRYIHDFVRGVIDGDGSIYTWTNNSNGLAQWCVTITSAAEKFIFWIKEVIENTYKIQGKIQYNTSCVGNPIYTLRFGKLAGQILLKEIYYASALALERKTRRAKLCLLDTKKMINYSSVIMY